MAEKKEKQYILPHYTDHEKTQLDMMVEYPNGNKGRMVVNKFGTNGDPNPDWEKMHNILDQDEIDKNTKLYWEERESHEERKKAEKARILGEELFNMKLEVFDVPEVRSSTDTAMKAKIRRAKNKTEVLLYAASLMQKEEIQPTKVEAKKDAIVDGNKTGDDTTEKSKPATKKKATKKTTRKKTVRKSNSDDDGVSKAD